MIYGEPTLITLEGDGIPMLSGDEIEYLREYHPELLGFWLKIIKGAGKVVGGIFRGIGKRVRRKRAERAARAQAQAKAQAEAIQRLNMVIAQRRAAAAAQKKKQQNTLLTAAAALPLAAAFLLGK